MSLPNHDEKKINNANREKLDELLTDALKTAESETSTPVKPKSSIVAKISEVKTSTPVKVKVNPKLPLFTEITDELKANPIIQRDLNSLILKYFEPSIKIEYRKGKISYLTQSEFKANYQETETRSFIKNIDICGILELENPVVMFKRSLIEKNKRTCYFDRKYSSHVR
jgi:hypothetical protein